MQINLDDIMFAGERYALSFLKNIANFEIESHTHITEKIINDMSKKYSWDNILKSEYGKAIVLELIAGCIIEYHEQLREKLQEMSIDIGEIDMDSDGILRLAALKDEADDKLDVCD